MSIQTKMKKILSLTLIASLLVFCLTACSTPAGTNTKTSSLPELKEINKDTIQQKAVLVVDPSVDNSSTENMLADFSNKFNIAIEKVEYGSAWTAFENQNSTVAGTSSELARNIETAFQGIEDEETLNNLYGKLNDALTKIIEKNESDIATEMAAAHEIFPEFSVEDYTTYVKEVSLMYTATLLEKVDPLNLPVLIVFNDVEITRIKGISQHPEKFAYVAAVNGIFDLEKTSSIDEVTKRIENAETFVAVYSTSTCSYCLDTVPILEKVAKENNIPLVEVNLASVKNTPEKLNSLLEKGYITSEISGTPTTYYYKDGKVADTQSGALSLTQVNSLFARNKNK